MGSNNRDDSGNRGEEIMTPNQQYRMVCGPHLDRLERTIETNSETIRDHTGEIKRMSNKVFNGFGSRIEAINDKLDREINTNIQSHAEIKSTLSLIAKFGATALILIFVALLGILGSIWAANSKSSDRDATSDQMNIDIERVIPETEVPSNEADNKIDQ